MMRAAKLESIINQPIVVFSILIILARQTKFQPFFIQYKYYFIFLCWYVFNAFERELMITNQQNIYLLFALTVSKHLLGRSYEFFRVCEILSRPLLKQICVYLYKF